MRFILVAQLGDEADIRISLEHVGQVLDRLTRCFVENATFARWRPTAFLIAVKVPQVAPGCNDNGIEQPGLHQATGGELLQSDAQREHGDERSHTHGNANRGERISQHRFAQVAHREFGQVRKLHRRSSLVSPAAAKAGFASSLTSLPSARKIRRWA